MDWWSNVLAEPERAIRYFKALDASERSLVLDMSYSRAKLLLELENAEDLKSEVNNAQNN